MGINEVWKKATEYPGGYLEVSSIGKVRVLPRDFYFVRKGKKHSIRRKGKILSPCIANHGYLEIAIQIDGKRQKFRVHRLVARAFAPGYAPDLTVNHIDGNKLNNHASNLEWVSLAKNTSHQWEIGLANLRGENHPLAKLTSKRVYYIRKLLSKGIPPHTLAMVAGVSPSTIYKIRDRRSWQ